MTGEVRLHGGNVAAAVVRVGETVRKPVGPQTPAVEAVLQHLESVGFDGAPKSLGRDERGRQVLEYVPGHIAHERAPMDAAGLRRVGRLIRDLHDALADFAAPPDAHWDVVIPPDSADLICHNDLAPWNLVLGADRWVIIDWDGAGPGSRAWDLDYAVTGFVPFEPHGDPEQDAPRLQALIDGYGLNSQERLELVDMIGSHARGMYDLLIRSATTGEQPWARLHSEGHAEYWGPAADYVERHREIWRRALSV